MKIKIILIFFLISFTSCVVRIYRKSEMNKVSNWSAKDGYVPDKATAIKIAEAVWLPRYGKNIYVKKPFNAELLGDSVWEVKGVLPKRLVGGVPYILIRKTDGTILKMYHTK